LHLTYRWDHHIACLLALYGKQDAGFQQTHCRNKGCQMSEQGTTKHASGDAC